MDDRSQLERLRYVAGNYEVLQGLVVLPLIIWAALAMAWAADWIGGWLVLGAALPAVAATFAAAAHYRRRYGRTRPTAGRSHSSFLLWPTTGLIVAVALVDALDPRLPVSVQGVILAGGALAGAWFQRPLAPAFLLVGCAGMVVSLVPLGGPGGPHPLSVTEHWIFAFCVGAAVVQVWSHIVLRRTFAPKATLDG